MEPGVEITTSMLVFRKYQYVGKYVKRLPQQKINHPIVTQMMAARTDECRE
jgi:hypothetical protein